MGKLKPGATYVYERVNEVTYTREAGADASTRQAIGWGQDSRTIDGRSVHEHVLESKMWAEIRHAAKTNPTLQDAVDRVIVIYKLSKTMT